MKISKRLLHVRSIQCKNQTHWNTLKKLQKSYVYYTLFTSNIFGLGMYKDPV